MKILCSRFLAVYVSKYDKLDIGIAFGYYPPPERVLFLRINFLHYEFISFVRLYNIGGLK